MAQAVFLVGLYLFGLNFGWLFRKKMPLAFICISGFLWGTLAWVVILALQLILPFRYSPGITILVMALLFIFTGALNVIQGNMHLNKAEMGWLGGSVLLACAAAWAAVTFNFSAASRDSVEQIFLARTIAYEGFIPWVAKTLAPYGVYLPALQSASVWLGASYLHGLQPLIGLSFLLCFGYLSYHCLVGLVGRKGPLFWLVSLSTLALFSAYFVIFQAFYIHNSLPAAAYFFVAIVAMWLAVREKNQAWLVFAMLSLTGFSLARIESPLFVIALLAVALSLGWLSRRARLIAILPYLGFIVIWYIKILVNMGQGYITNDPGKMSMMIAALVIFGGLVAASGIDWLERFILPRLHIIMLAVLALGLALAIATQPGHMADSILATVQNFFQYGEWEATWLVLGGLFLFSFLQPALPGGRLFSFNIRAFFLLLFILVFNRDPYRISWGDSANRMLTHIAPVCFLYLSMKYANGYFSKVMEEIGLPQAEGQNNSTFLLKLYLNLPRIVMAVVGLVFVGVALLVFR
jgi:hypothetical protein